MAKAGFRFSVGRSRVTADLTPEQAGYVQYMRKQFEDVIENLKEYIAYLEAIAPDAMEEAMRPTFEKSQMYCPVKTGKMRASGFMETGGTRQRPVLTMGYGKNGEPPYTAIVHERIELHHAPPTRAKWLQVALEEDYFNILSRISGAMAERGANG